MFLNELMNSQYLLVIEMRRKDPLEGLRQHARKVVLRRDISPSLKRDLLQFYGFDVTGRKIKAKEDN